jgi:hypothetical protein
MQSPPPPEDELKRRFLEKGTDFFGIQSGKNIPNILEMLSRQVGALEVALKRASASSDKLASALNRLTLAGVILSALGIAVAIVALIMDHGQ